MAIMKCLPTSLNSWEMSKVDLVRSDESSWPLLLPSPLAYLYACSFLMFFLQTGSGTPSAFRPVAQEEDSTKPLELAQVIVRVCEKVSCALCQEGNRHQLFAKLDVDHCQPICGNFFCVTKPLWGTLLHRTPMRTCLWWRILGACTSVVLYKKARFHCTLHQINLLSVQLSLKCGFLWFYSVFSDNDFVTFRPGASAITLCEKSTTSCPGVSNDCTFVTCLSFDGIPSYPTVGVFIFCAACVS